METKHQGRAQPQAPGRGPSNAHNDGRPEDLLDTRRAWMVATMALACLGLSFGAPLIAIVGLKTIAADMGDARSVPALAGSLAWLGSAVGGVLMGRLANRFGIRWTVIGGALSVCAGLAISTLGTSWALYLGHGVFIGLLGLSGLNAPLYVYISHWFVRRRGSALALLSSGNYIAGIVWPVIFESVIDRFGWRATMVGYGLVQVSLVATLAVIFLRPPPQASTPAGAAAPSRAGKLAGMRPNTVFAMLGVAGFLCCVPMAMPQGHLVALCSDRGLPATVGAAMLSSLLAVAFLSRQGWGLVADRIGGVRTALISSFMQMVAVSGYLYVQQQFGLFAVSIAYGLGFSALIPAYVLSVREIFPPRDAYWRVPAMLLMTGSGMAAGGWVAGFLYDRYASYDPAFMLGVAANVVNLVLLATLTVKLHGGLRVPAMRQA
ncbi:MFS transporter [Bordetella bronchialis]|nr:MFS transporter [Bordetella bronchialis]